MPTKETRFLELVNQHKGVLYKIARMYQAHTEDQSDLVQEMTLELWRSFDSFRGDSQFSTWMYKVALNTAIVFLRKEKKRPQSTTLMLHEDIADPQDPATALEMKEKLTLFYAAVRELGQMEKALVFLYMEDVPGAEIAVQLGISPENVRVRISRVKDKLTNIIKAKNHGYGRF